MSLETQQRGLFIAVSRKRNRSPSSRREESLLLAPTTPPATERKRIFDEDENDDELGVTTQEWAHNYVSEILEPHKITRNRPWWAQQDALQLLAYQDDLDDDASPNFREESSSHLQPFAMSTFDLSAELYNICTQSRTKAGLFSLSREDTDNIANAAAAAAAAVTTMPSTPRPPDHKPVDVQPAPTVEILQSSRPEDEESRIPLDDSKHDHPSGEENSVGSSA